MEKIYIITQLDDYEYGCRKIHSVWSKKELAEKYIEKVDGDNEHCKMWDGRELPVYKIEEWEIDAEAPDRYE